MTGAAPIVGPGVRAVRFGLALFALTSTALVAALALDLHTGTYRTLVYIGAAEALALLGVLLTTRRPEHPISWVLAITAWWGAIGGLSYAYAVKALVADPDSLPGGLVAAWVDGWWWLPGLALPLGALLLSRAPSTIDGRSVALLSLRLVPVPTLGSLLN